MISSANYLPVIRLPYSIMHFVTCSLIIPGGKGLWQTGHSGLFIVIGLVFCGLWRWGDIYCSVRYGNGDDLSLCTCVCCVCCDVSVIFCASNALTSHVYILVLSPPQFLLICLLSDCSAVIHLRAVLCASKWLLGLIFWGFHRIWRSLSAARQWMELCFTGLVKPRLGSDDGNSDCLYYLVSPNRIANKCQPSGTNWEQKIHLSPFRGGDLL